MNQKSDPNHKNNIDTILKMLNNFNNLDLRDILEISKDRFFSLSNVFDK